MGKTLNLQWSDFYKYWDDMGDIINKMKKESDIKKVYFQNDYIIEVTFKKSFCADNGKGNIGIRGGEYIIILKDSTTEEIYIFKKVQYNIEKEKQAIKLFKQNLNNIFAMAI